MYGLGFGFQTKWLHCTMQNMFIAQTQAPIPTPYFCIGQESNAESISKSISGKWKWAIKRQVGAYLKWSCSVRLLWKPFLHSVHTNGRMFLWTCSCCRNRELSLSKIKQWLCSRVKSMCVHLDTEQVGLGDEDRDRRNSILFWQH